MRSRVVRPARAGVASGSLRVGESADDRRAVSYLRCIMFGGNKDTIKCVDCGRALPHPLHNPAAVEGENYFHASERSFGTRYYPRPLVVSPRRSRQQRSCRQRHEAARSHTARQRHRLRLMVASCEAPTSSSRPGSRLPIAGEWARRGIAARSSQAAEAEDRVKFTRALGNTGFIVVLASDGDLGADGVAVSPRRSASASRRGNPRHGHLNVRVTRPLLLRYFGFEACCFVA
jgi:hypothetical protein